MEPALHAAKHGIPRDGLSGWLVLTRVSGMQSAMAVTDHTKIRRERPKSMIVRDQEVDSTSAQKSLEAVVLVHRQGHDAEEVALHLQHGTRSRRSNSRPYAPAGAAFFRPAPSA